MRRLLPAVVLVLALNLAITAQQHERPEATPTAGEHAAAGSAAHEGEHAESDGLSIWKWANFAILAGVLGWVVAKAAPAFFRSRTEEIQRGIADATRMKLEAEAATARMEARMASLQSEIENIRAVSRSEIAREADRLHRESELHMSRIEAHADQEIKALSKHAQQRLTAHAAELAVQLAERKIRARMDGKTQEMLFNGFVHQLDQKAESGEVRQ